jgi:hypothetical protein
MPQAFHGNVGTKTTLRVINHARSRDACCAQRKYPQDLPDKANVKNYDFLLWCVLSLHPAPPVPSWSGCVRAD